MTKTWKWNVVLVLGVAVVCAVSAHAQTPAQSAPSDLLAAYSNAATGWTKVGFKYANNLFLILAGLEFAWLGTTLVLQGEDLQSWVAQVLKKMMTILFFYMILSQYQTWVPAIIDSFVQVGQESSGINKALNPSDILFTGLRIAGAMLSAATPSATKTGATLAAAVIIPGAGEALTAAVLLPTLIVFLGSCAVFAAYLIITITFIMATIESYITLGAGVIFLGFGASRWTVPYVERYISLAVSTGARLMVLYMIIGLGQTLGAQWISDASNLTLSIKSCQTIMGIVAGALTYMAVAWSVPKLVSGMLGGSVSMGSSDLIAPVTAAAVGAATAAAAVATGGAALMATGGAALAGIGASGTLSAGAAAASGAAAGSTASGTAAMATEAATPLAVGPASSAAGVSPIDMSTGSIIADPPSENSGGTGTGPSTTSNSSDESSSNTSSADSVSPPAAANGSEGPSGAPGSVTQGTTGGGAAPGRSMSGGASSSNAGPAAQSVGPQDAAQGTGEVPPPESIPASAPLVSAESLDGGVGGTAAEGQFSAAVEPPTGGSNPAETKPSGGAEKENDSSGTKDVANMILSMRDEASKLASHAPQDSTTASAATLNLHHGD